MKNRTSQDPTTTCFSCGRQRYVTATRPFGFHADGTVATRVCIICADEVTVAKPRPIPGLPAIAWTTIARAERLVYMGVAATPDKALRRGLALLEQEALEVTA